MAFFLYFANSEESFAELDAARRLVDDWNIATEHFDGGDWAWFEIRTNDVDEIHWIRMFSNPYYSELD